jgi:hypothetical protein
MFPFTHLACSRARSPGDAQPGATSAPTQTQNECKELLNDAANDYAGQMRGMNPDLLRGMGTGDSQTPSEDGRTVPKYRVRRGSNRRHPSTFINRIVPRVSIRLQRARELTQVCYRVFALAIRRVGEPHRWWALISPGPVIKGS